jgi:hypothetical protein
VSSAGLASRTPTLRGARHHRLRWKNQKNVVATFLQNIEKIGNESDIY